MKLHEWKTRIQSGEHLLGTMVTTFASADLPKILKACGFDFFIIDCEHGSFTTREVADISALHGRSSCPAWCVSRSCGASTCSIAWSLARRDCCCRTQKRRSRRVSSSIMPNTRPWGTVVFPSPGPHTDFLKQDSAAYMHSANRDTVLLCQIESQLGVSNIDAIMAVDGIDGAMIGPNDMSQDFGILGQYAHPAMQAAFRQVIDARCAARQGFRRTFRCSSTAAAVAEPGHDAQYVQQ